MPRAFAAPETMNLKPLLSQLDEQGIDYRLIKRDGQLELWVSDEQLAQRIHDVFVRVEAAQTARVFSFQNVKIAPVTAMFVLISIVVAVVTQLGTAFTEPLQIADLIHYPRSWHWELSPEYLIRLFTPMFLHFSLGHIVFNMIGLWYLGLLLEHRIGHGLMFALVMTISLISNIAQLVISGPLFGGFSGVVYGLLGFACVYQYWVKPLGIPKGLFVFAGVWLLLGLVDAFTIIGIYVANTAHISGLIAGMLLAVLWLWWHKLTS